MKWNDYDGFSRPVSQRALWGALLSGLLCGAAFAPFKLWPLAFVAMFGLLASLHQQTGKRAFRLTWLFAMAMNLPSLWWIHVSMTQFGGISLPAAFVLVAILCAYLSLYPALAAALLNRFFPRTGVTRLLFAFPALWLLSDWAMGHVMTGFPWMWLGYSQVDTWLTGFAPLFGVQSITLAVLWSAAACLLCWQQRRILWLLLPPLLFVTGYGLQQKVWTQPGETVNFALAQGNIPQSSKWEADFIKPTLVRYLDLTRESKGADIIIWPESAVPALENDMREFMTNMDDALRSQKAGFITGIQYYDQSLDRYYNGVVATGLIDKEGQRTYQYGQGNRWYKHHLLPIGEFVPFGDLLRPIAPFFDLPMSSFSRGDAVQENLLSGGYKFATSICYEMEYSDELRQNIHEDTQFIVNVSNDSWFGTSGGPWQHMEIARMRAIEFGKAVVRATNSGVTVAFDHQGKIIGMLPQFEQKVLRVDVAPTTGVTPYTRWGSLPLIAFCIVALIIGLWRQNHKRPRYL
ncbi:MAG: apolipoprotein N-acyltransferase [Gammaproteobacteria bacterium]|nr:apolipoprotein N-acyltransferase [Gammaproteobacteria bacterium]